MCGHSTVPISDVYGLVEHVHCFTSNFYKPFPNWNCISTKPPPPLAVFSLATIHFTFCLCDWLPWRCPLSETVHVHPPWNWFLLLECLQGLSTLCGVSEFPPDLHPMASRCHFKMHPFSAVGTDVAPRLTLHTRMGLSSHPGLWLH